MATITYCDRTECAYNMWRGNNHICDTDEVVIDSQGICAEFITQEESDKQWEKVKKRIEEKAKEDK